MFTVYTTSALQHLSDLQLRGLLRRVRYDLDCSTPNSYERRDALLTIENIYRVLAQRSIVPGRRGAKPRCLPALRKRSAGIVSSQGIPPTKPLVSSFLISVSLTPT